jgi:hypothetical protein
MEIKCVYIFGDFDTRRIFPLFYDRQRTKFFREYGVSLPIKKEAKRIGRLSQLRVVINPVTVRILFVGGEYVEYIFNRGWITDLASVPKFFRGVIDNDDLDLLAAAYVHDANFTGHYLQTQPGSDGELKGLWRTNELFRLMIRHRGAKFKAWLAHKAVDSIVGHALYFKMPGRRGVTMDRVIFDSNNVKYGGRI